MNEFYNSNSNMIQNESYEFEDELQPANNFNKEDCKDEEDLVEKAKEELKRRREERKQHIHTINENRAETDTPSKMM